METLRRNLLALHGQAGDEWLARIPEMLDRCVAQWSLSIGDVCADASYSYLVRTEHPPAVLKLSFPDADADREAAALRAFAGQGCVALLAHDPSVAALLLSRVEPGHPLARLCEREDERATSIAASVIRRLPRDIPADAAFPSVQTWPSEIEHLSREVAPEIRALAFDALAIAGELARSSSQPRLLHGDLHQFNILAAGDAWLAIDRKGIIGEPECEIGPLILNPISSDLSKLATRRIRQLCDELDLNCERARAWTFVRAVLAILWSIEDHGDVRTEWIAFAKTLVQ